MRAILTAAMTILVLSVSQIDHVAADQGVVTTRAGTTLQTSAAQAAGSSGTLSQFTFVTTDSKTGQTSKTIIRGTPEQIGKTEDVLKYTCSAHQEREQARAQLELYKKPRINPINGEKMEPEQYIVEEKQKALDEKEAALKKWLPIYPDYFNKAFDVSDCPAKWR